MLIENIRNHSTSVIIPFLLFLVLQFTGCSNIEERADQALAKLSDYEAEEGLTKLTEFSELVSEAAHSKETSQALENSIIKFLKSDASLASKRFVGQQLSIIGSKNSIPVLSKMLLNFETADIALYPLERIPGKEASAALIGQLESDNKTIRIGCINALGIRQCKSSVPKIVELLEDKDQEVAISAASALGAIQGDEAISALKQDIKNSNIDLQIVVIDSYLRCADSLTKDNALEAIGIYQEVYNDKLPLSSRQAALVGLIEVSDNKTDIINNSLANDEDALKNIAIDGLRQLSSSKDLLEFSSMLPKLSQENQIQLLGVIKDRADKKSKKTVLRMLKSSEPLVRIAALQTLSVIGDGSDILTIAMLAASKSGLERRNARECLVMINDDEANELIIENISLADKKIKIELIRAAGDRGIESSFDILLKNTQSDDRQIRTAAYLAIAEIATEDKLSLLINQLYTLPFENDRIRMERTISRVLSIYPEEKFVNVLINNINKDKSADNKGSSLKLLGVTGNSKALEVLRKNVVNENQTIKIGAIEGLASWSTPEPLYDLMKATETSENEKIKQPALKGFINFVKMDESLDHSTKFELYSKALNYAKTGNEKNLALEGLGHVYVYETLDVLKTYYKDPSVSETVKSGINRVSWNLVDKDPAKIKSYLLEIIQITSDERYKERFSRIISSADLVLNK